MATITVSSPTYDADASISIVRRRVELCLKNEFRLTDCAAQSDFQIHVGTPDSVPQKTSGVPLIAYTFSEATRVPAHWVSALDRCDRIWAGSQFTAESLRNSGLKKEIVVVPLGVDCPSVPLRSPCQGHRPFTFYWQGTRLKYFLNGREVDGDRKRGLLVEHAFRRAEIPNSRLILKFLPVEGREYDIRCGSIWYVCKSLNDEQILELDAQSDVFVWPTMGEGFGLPPLEKLAQGIPSFPTFWSSPVDYMQDFPLPRLLPTQIVPVRFNGEMAEMADISLESLTCFMKDCYETRDHLVALRSTLHSIALNKWDFRSRMRSKLISEIHRFLSASPRNSK